MKNNSLIKTGYCSPGENAWRYGTSYPDPGRTDGYSCLSLAFIGGDSWSGYGQYGMKYDAVPITGYHASGFYAYGSDYEYQDASSVAYPTDPIMLDINFAFFVQGSLCKCTFTGYEHYAEGSGETGDQYTVTTVEEWVNVQVASSF